MAAALALTACTGAEPGPVDAPSASPTTSAPPVVAEPAQPRVAIGDRVWGTGETGIARPDRVAFVDDVAIVAGRGAGVDAASAIVAVEAATGRPLWSRSTSEPLPGAPGVLWSTTFTPVDGAADGDALVVVELKAAVDRGHDHVVAALSAADGSVRWTRTVLSAADASVDGEPRAHSAELMKDVGPIGTDGAVLVVAGPVRSLFGGDTADPGTLRTIALDPSTGDERWRAGDVVGRWVVGDAVVATTRAGVDFGLTGGPLVLDAATGAERWRAGDEYARTMTAAPSAGLVHVDFAETTVRQVLSLVDGSVVAEVGAALSATADPTTDFVAWVTYNPDGEPAKRLVTYAPGDAEPSGAGDPPSLDDVRLVLSAAGYVWATRADAATRLDATYALDRSGTVLSGTAAGTAFAATDRWLVTVGGAGGVAPDTFSVHPLTR